MRTPVIPRDELIARIAEVFRELGYEASSLSEITAHTGLSKGGLYHFFPEGKEQMAREVLSHIHAWFEREVFAPLEQEAPLPGLARMWRAVERYFRSGHRVCLVGALSLDRGGDPFARDIQRYFAAWLLALQNTLIRGGMDRERARAAAEETVQGIQGALILARAMDDADGFVRACQRLSRRLERALR